MRRSIVLFVMLAAIALLAACTVVAMEKTEAAPAVEPATVAEPAAAAQEAPAMPQEEPAAALTTAQYIGSEACSECHEDTFNSYMQTGHPYKLNKVVDGQPPEYPFSEVPNPPEGYTWDDILYVIGGYGWKARFIDKDGFIITGDENATTQYNLWNDDLEMGDNWVAYHAGEEKPYDCGSCHTTGYRPEGNQDGLPGLIGTWVEDGIGCEECHGPGSNHVEDPYMIAMTVNRDSELCGQCHIRGDITEIDASGGFIRHHEQYEELFESKKRVMRCVDCHNPHQTVKYAKGLGIKTACANCHFEQDQYQRITDRRHAECIDCHMPRMSKSALGDPEHYSGDLRTHLMAINPTATEQFGDEGGTANPYLALDFACKSCHNVDGKGGELPDEDLVAAALGYHDRAEAGSLNRQR